MKTILIFLMVTLSACTTSPRAPLENDAKPSSAALFVEKGYQLLSERKTKKAIAEFDKAIDLCGHLYGSKVQRVYASRSLIETIYYMSEAAADNVKAITVLPTCSDALYLKGYASLDLGRVEIAEQYIKRALAMAPVNAMYLSELGHLQHSKRDWLGAIEIFTQAESAAEKFSPPEIKDQELTRAKRGIGYSLTELGKLDEAEEKFKECLDINPQDSVALREIDYIKNLRTQGLGEADTSKDIDH